MRWKTNALFNPTVHKHPRVNRNESTVSQLFSKQAICSPYTNTSLPCTSSHWWVLCPRWAAGRMCDTLYHTCHTPASCYPPLGSYRPEKGYCKLEQRMISDTGLGAFANKTFWPNIMFILYGQLGKFQWQEICLSWVKVLLAHQKRIHV